MRVLLVEDDRMIGESIRAALKGGGAGARDRGGGRRPRRVDAAGDRGGGAGGVVGARIRGARGADAAARGHPVAGAAGGPPVRMGRCDREQCGVSLRPSAAPQAGQRLHSQRARRRLLRGPARGEPVKSIRTRLLVSLLSVVLLSAAASAALTYTNVLSEAQALFDYQLPQRALSLRDQGFIAPDQAAALAN